MEKQIQIDVDVLVEEIQRYLAVVDVFRALGCNPGKARRKEWTLPARWRRPFR